MTEQEKLIAAIEKVLREMKDTATDAYLVDQKLSPVYVRNNIGFILNKIKQLKQIQR